QSVNNCYLINLNKKSPYFYEDSICAPTWARTRDQKTMRLPACTSLHDANSAFTLYRSNIWTTVGTTNCYSVTYLLRFCANLIVLLRIRPTNCILLGKFSRLIFVS